MLGETDNNLRILVLERQDPAAWSYWPIAWRRVEAFCRKYDSDANLVVLWQTLVANFASSAPTTLMLLLLRPQGVVIGHLLITIEDWIGCRMATINQLEVDVPLTPEVIQPAYDWICRWAEGQKAEQLQCLARDKVLARLFRTKYDFVESRVLMRKRLRGKDGECPKGPRCPDRERDKEMALVEQEA